MERKLCYPAGTVLTLTTGSHGETHIRGQVVTIKAVDLARLAQTFCVDRCEMTKEEREYLPVVQPDLFPDWLVANGHAVPLRGEIVHMGSYLHFSDEFHVPDIEDKE